MLKILLKMTGKMAGTDDLRNYLDMNGKEIEHILMRPHVQLGNLELENKYQYCYPFDVDGGTEGAAKIELKPVLVSDGLEQTSREVLYNAADAVERSRLAGIPGALEVTLTPSRITVKNYGLGIKVEQSASGEWWPEILFAKLRSSSNLDDSKTRTVSGVNGLGIKLANIFSKEFTVRCVDIERGLYFEQTFYNNLSQRTPPVVTPLTGDKPPCDSVEVSYVLDFPRFGLTEYSREYLQMLARYCLEISMLKEAPLCINGKAFPPISMETYGKLFYTKSSRQCYTFKSEDIQFCLIDASGEEDKSSPSAPPVCMSFVNSNYTPRGGAHVNTILTKVLKTLVDSNLFPRKSNAKGNSSADDLTNDDLAKVLGLIVGVVVDKPLFTEQAKTKFKSPVPQFELSKDLPTILRSWSIITKLKAVLEAKDLIRQRVTDGAKVKKVLGLGNSLKDANFAGTMRSSEASLFICEGNSASKYIEKFRKFIPNGSDCWGCARIRGKILNVINSGVKQLIESFEINMIKKALGLREGLDYTRPENFATLRYGRVVIAVDADIDGLHIHQLLNVLFFTKYPSLLQIPFVYAYETPIVRLTRGKETLKFYRQSELEVWLKNQNLNDVPPGWNTHYYKGLGTSEDSDILEDIQAFRIVVHSSDADSSNMITLASDNRYSNSRKDWLRQYIPTRFEAPQGHQTISEFVRDDLILYILQSLVRAIPSVYDNMKDVQRKIAYAARIHASHAKPHIKTAQLAASLAEKMLYHHGEGSFAEAILRMGLDYVGTNNIPLIDIKGQSGSREDNEIVAPRYNYSRCSKLMKYIFRTEDDPCLEKCFDEGKEIEPKYLMGVVPMVLINGCRGIASAYSTFCPAYNPLVIIEWLRVHLGGVCDPAAYPPLIPWYRGYKGTISFNEDNTAFITEGTFEIIKQNASSYDVVISELPLFRFMDTYKEFLDLLMSTKDGEGNKKESQLREYNVDLKAEAFILKGLKLEPTTKNLQLRRVFSMRNMVLLDENLRPTTFETPQDILRTFAKHRLVYYQKRKDYTINKLQEDVIKTQIKIKYIETVVSGRLTVVNRNVKELKAEMTSLGFPDSLLNLKTYSLTREGLMECIKELDSLEREITETQSVSIETMWLQELDEFEREYRKSYKE